ncbi:MAG: hypothetical protein HYX68_08680 [Planctomycetes bacterium]|nr:hypothetical protein [Planctomycetota bacterium]
MRHAKQQGARSPRCLFFLAGVLVSALFAPAISVAADPVDRLRDALQIDPGFKDPDLRLLAKRKKLLDAALAEINKAKSISQLRRAYFLKEWSQEVDLDAKVPAPQVEGPRARIGKLLIQTIRETAAQKQMERNVALAILIGEMADDEKLVSDGKAFQRKPKQKFARAVTDVVITLAREKGDLAVQQSALHALGKITPDPALAIPVLREAITRDINLGPRRLAAYALVDLVKNSRTLQRGERLDTIDLVVATAALGLENADERTRGYCLQAIDESAQALVDFILSPEEPLTFEPKKGERKIRKDVRKILQSCQAVTPGLLNALHAREIKIRLSALKTLDHIAQVRVKLLQAFQVAPDMDEDRGQVFKDLDVPDPFASIVDRDPKNRTWEKVADLLDEQDARLRRGAIGLFEVLAEQAEPAAARIVKALEDTDLLVRWTAARSIRRLSTKQVRVNLIGALAVLLLDADSDLANAAAAAIEKHGDVIGKVGQGQANNPLAGLVKNLAIVIANGDANAVPGANVGNRVWDVESRKAALKALAALGGPPAQPAFPAALLALTDTEVRLRRQAAATIDRLGRPASPSIAAQALIALRKALADEDAEVRLHAAEAILSLTQRK